MPSCWPPLPPARGWCHPRTLRSAAQLGGSLHHSQQWLKRCCWHAAPRLHCGIDALAKAVERMPARRRSVVISGAGDRRDEDITLQTAILGKVFDDMVLFEDACQRGRADGEVLSLLRAGAANAPRTRSVTEVRGEFLAIDTALARLEPGDLCLILIDQVEEALAHIGRRVAEAQADGHTAPVPVDAHTPD